MKDATEISLQAKVFDFALSELVRQNRKSFQPLWTIDSWVKFLIWITLNIGLSGEKDSFSVFAEAMGPRLTARMRRIFFERILEDLNLQIMADPAESQVLVLPINGQTSLDYEKVAAALEKVGLSERVVSSRSHWKALDAVIAIPWSIVESSS